MEKYDGNCKARSFVTVPVITAAVLIGMFFGVLFGIWWGTRHAAYCIRHDTDDMTHTPLEENEITYGISDQNLRVHSVEWKDFPSWREVAFSVEGSISFITEQNRRIVSDAFANPEALEEIHREHCVASNGKDLIYYDEVTYRINEATVNTVIPKVDTPYDIVVMDTVNNSFYIVFSEKDSEKEVEYIAGSIFPFGETYTVWTKEQAAYFDTNIDAYLSVFALSGTYGGSQPLRERTQREGIVLKKDEGSFLNCTMYNHGSDVWRYETQLPHVELWYKGMWLELLSPYADNLTTAEIKPGQNRGFAIPDETIAKYPSLIDGIYRLVIYGENEEFVVSDTFKKESDISFQK